MGRITMNSHFNSDTIIYLSKSDPSGISINSLGLFVKKSALAGVALWIFLWPVNQRATGSIPSQGTCLGWCPGPQWGGHKKQPHIYVSLPLSLLAPLSKYK